MKITTENLVEVLDSVLRVFGALLLTSSFCTKSDKKTKHKLSRGKSKKKKSRKPNASSKGSSVTPSDASASAKGAVESDSESKKKSSTEKKSKVDAGDADLAHDKKSGRTPKSHKSHKDVVDEKPKPEVASAQAKEPDLKTSEDLVLSVVKPSRLDYSALAACILERMEGKTQEGLPEDEKLPDVPAKATEPPKPGTSSAKDQKHPQKASKASAVKANSTSAKKPVYKARKPSEFVSVFAGSLAPKAVGSAAPTAPMGATVKLPAIACPVQASPPAKEPSKPVQIGDTMKPPVAVPTTAMTAANVAKEPPKLAPAPPVVPTKQSGAAPVAMPPTATKPPPAAPAGAKQQAPVPPKPPAGPASQQPAQPAGPAPAPAPGPPSKIPSDCVRV
ncbi:hypothetical protein Aduo_000807 [Ancylostoma duodenale]